MSLINWDNSLSVNVTEIDEQHKVLIKMINELNDAMKLGKGKDVIEKIISGLINYTASHFKTEEKYFDKYYYPQSMIHKKEHEAFVQKVSDFKSKFDNGSIGLSVQILNFLSDWLRTHIKSSDMKYSEFFNQKGIK